MPGNSTDIANRIFSMIAAQQGANNINPIIDALNRNASGQGVVGGISSQPSMPHMIPPVAPGGAAINQLGQLATGLGPNITGQGLWANLPNFGVGYD